MKSRGNNSIIFGLKVQKHLARGRASASPRVNVPYNGRTIGGKSVPVGYLFGEKLLLFYLSQY
ncbi:MAG: hypothetical protein MR734_04705 [Bacteroidales bacterium]|nr:hypothetical protein [Bacteroidales bacterium]